VRSACCRRASAMTTPPDDLTPEQMQEAMAMATAYIDLGHSLSTDTTSIVTISRAFLQSRRDLAKAEQERDESDAAFAYAENGSVSPGVTPDDHLAAID